GLPPTMAVPPAGRPRAGAALVAKLDAGNEAVTARAVPLLGVLVGPRFERGQRSVTRRGKHHRNARLRIIEFGRDRVLDALEAIDVAPRRVPLAEVGGQFVDGSRKRVDALLRCRLPGHELVDREIGLPGLWRRLRVQIIPVQT